MINHARIMPTITDIRCRPNGILFHPNRKAADMNSTETPGDKDKGEQRANDQCGCSVLGITAGITNGILWFAIRGIH
jgi:hypothetical protein